MKVLSLPGLWGERSLVAGLRYLAARAIVLGGNESSSMLMSLRATGRPLIFYHWTEDEVPRLLLALRGVNLGTDVSCVVDDTLGGGLGAAVLKRCGCDTVGLRVSSRALMIRDIRALLRHPTHLSISADGRGPYRVINPALPDLIRARRALAIPVGVRVDRCYLRTLRSWPLVVPRLRARIAVAVGAALEIRADGVPLLAEGLENALAQSSSLLR